jgi:hypothetical protein
MRTLGKVTPVRALAFTWVLLGLPVAALAAPVHKLDGFDANLVHANSPRLIMPGEFSYGAATANQEPRELVLDLSRSQGGMLAPAGISLGPVRAESEIINGHRRMHYRIDGFSLMGGEIGGSVSHHGAMLTLHWGR